MIRGASATGLNLSRQRWRSQVGTCGKSFGRGTPYWDYFASQLEWMKRLADDPREPWTSKGLVVRAFEDRDLSPVERALAIT